MESFPEMFDFLFYHVFLPPKLPSEVEPELPKLESELVRVVGHVLRDFIQDGSYSCQPQWHMALNLLDSWIDFDLHSGGEGIREDLLEQALLNLGPNSKSLARSVLKMN